MRDRDHVVRAPLTGRLFDADGNPMTPSFSHGASGKVYRYYVSAPLQQGARLDARQGEIRRVSANAIERLLGEMMAGLLPERGHDALGALVRAEVHTGSLQLSIQSRHLTRMRERLPDGAMAERDPVEASRLLVTVPIRMQLRGGRTSLVRGDVPRERRDPVLIKALRKAHAMLPRDRSGAPALEVAPAVPYHRLLLRLAFLAPDLQRDILAGRQPEELTLERLVRGDIPPEWDKQRRLFSRRS